MFFSFENKNANPASLYQELSFHEGRRMSQEEKTKFVDRIINNGLDDVQNQLDSSFKYLATDGSTFRGPEGFVGYRFEKKTGRTLTRGPTGEVDFFDENGVPWDALGPIPATKAKVNELYAKSLPDHLAKMQHGVPCNVIIDLAGQPPDVQKSIMKTVTSRSWWLQAHPLKPGQTIEFITDF